MENLLAAPMENFVKVELDTIKEKKKAKDKCKEKYEGALSKASQMKKKNQNAMKVLEVLCRT
jgi:hypothetical protein